MRFLIFFFLLMSIVCSAEELTLEKAAIKFKLNYYELEEAVRNGKLRARWDHETETLFVDPDKLKLFLKNLKEEKQRKNEIGIIISKSIKEMSDREFEVYLLLKQNEKYDEMISAQKKQATMMTVFTVAFIGILIWAYSLN